MTIGTATELWRMSATELADLIRTRQASSQEVVEAHLQRIETVDPLVNAVPVVLAERALEAARAVDSSDAGGGDLPPFVGVPFVVKSNIDVAGTPTTQGARAFTEAYPTMLNTPDARALWDATSQMMPDDTRRFLRQFYESAGDPDPAATVRSFVTRHSLLRAWNEFQETHPLIVAPICSDIPFRAGSDLDEGRVAEEIRSLRMTIAVNALGLPAAAVPVGLADGLPQAVEVIGPRYGEDLCLDAAQPLEERLGIITPIEPR